MTISQIPASYQVSTRHEESHDTVTLTLEPAGDPIADFRPGQFTMLYAFGIGEIPVSVSGRPGQFALAQTIRQRVPSPQRSVRCPAGQIVGVRGPFGTCWNETDAAGRDLLLVAGGIGLAPLRSALLAALSDRQRYRRVVVLIGARSPAELVFGGEIDAWRASGAEVMVTVDRAAASWRGNVGVVTQLISRAGVDPPNTTALICGPEVMMRLTARSLLATGMAAGDIRLSLERNMQCGVAECGHCQLGPLLLCRDGPVVSYQIAEPLLATREL